MRVNKFIRLWVHRGRGGIDDASPTSVSILLPFIMTPVYLVVDWRHKCRSYHE